MFPPCLPRCAHDRGLLVVLLCILFGGFSGLGPCAQAQTESEDTKSQARSDTIATGDTTRAERWREERRMKAQSSRSTEKGFFARVDQYVMGTALSVIPNRIALNIPNVHVAGVKPVIGKMGGGVTAGVLYEPLAARGDDRLLSFEAVGSPNRYYGAKALFGREVGRYFAYGFARYQHRPDEDFFGIGPDSENENRSTFRLNEGLFGGLGGRSIGENMLVGGHLTYQFNRIGEGRGDDPDLQTQFGTHLPGMRAGSDHVMVGAFFEFDSRDASYQRSFGHRFAPTENRLRSVSLEASRGFYLTTEITHNIDTQSRAYGFTRYTLDAREFIPVDEGLFHGFAFRQFASFTQSGDAEVPFYRLQSIGGSRSLRGFESGRFRDRNVLLFNAEMRFQVWHKLDMAFFSDAGHVFHDVGSLGSDGVAVGYGLGFRYRKDGQTLSRVDLARSVEGWKVTLDIGSLF